MHQDLQKLGAQVIIHGLVGRDLHLPVRPPALATQPGFLTRSLRSEMETFTSQVPSAHVATLTALVLLASHPCS